MGQKLLREHSQSNIYKGASKARLQTHSISGFAVSEAEEKCLQPHNVYTKIPDGALLNIKPHMHVESKSQEVPVVSYTDRKTDAEAMVINFIAEHSLPLSVSPHLIDLANELSRDQRALDAIFMERQTAIYKLVYGLDEALTKRMS